MSSFMQVQLETEAQAAGCRVVRRGALSVFSTTTFATLSTVILLLLAACGDEHTDEAVTFSDLRVEGLSATSATIAFETSRPTTCAVEFGIEISTFDRTAVDPNMGATNELSLEHNVPLEDLQPSTTYYLRALAEDADGNVYRSTADSFVTPAEDVVDRGPNLALLSAGASIVEVSSNFGGGDVNSQWGANNAFDGALSSEWASDGDGDSAFIVVALSEPSEVTGFGFRSRRMPDDSSIITSVEVLVDGSTRLGPFDTPDWGTTYHFEFDLPVTGQEIRIEVLSSTGGNTGAKEIEIYGTR